MQTQRRDQDSDVVQHHYNAKREYNEKNAREQAQRHIQPITRLHNWIKSVLITEYTPKAAIVLDMAGGKGGDLLKWGHAHIGQLVLADVSPVSIQHAAQRYTKFKTQCRFPAAFIYADCFNVRFQQKLAQRFQAGSFDVVSCQFALHYAFQSRERAAQALRTVAWVLKPGGIFIGTIPHAKTLQARAAHASGTFGNTYYKICFDLANDDDDNDKQEDDDDAFGQRYTFHLCEAIDGAPEYIVPLSQLQTLGAELGLSLTMYSPFREFYERYRQMPPYRKLLSRMMGGDGVSMSDAHWEVSDLYAIFVFCKNNNDAKPKE